MANLPFDSLAYSERLQEAGVPAQQAAVHAKTLGEVLARSVVFPDDIMRLEASLSQKFDIAQLKMTTEFEKLRSDMNVLKAMMGILISLMLPIFFKLYFA
jgi:hypothetical protein